MDFIKSHFAKDTPDYIKLHHSEEQIKRQLNAHDCVPSSINVLKGEAIFQSKRFHGGTYNTNLCECSYPDFIERKLPCKHMYRLASIMGLIELTQKPEKQATGNSYKRKHLDEILAMDNPNEHEEQRVRQRNAKKCHVIDINKEAETAIFGGSGKRPYYTTLDSCTCQDFGMRHLPCKHIYRLAHELGKFNLDEVPDGRVSEIKRERFFWNDYYELHEQYANQETA